MFNKLVTVTQQKPSLFGSVVAFLHRSKRTVLLIVVVAVVTLTLSAFLSIILDDAGNLSFPSLGRIHTVGVKAYWDQDETNETKQIIWGTVFTGLSYNVTLYLRSTSNVQTKLELTTTNWTYINTNDTIAAGPVQATPYMNLTWNYNNQTLDPGHTIPTTLTLTADNSEDFVKFLINNNIRQFTMDITIEANEK